MTRRRSIVIFCLLCAFLVMLLGQLIHVQVIDHDYYLKRSQESISQIELQRPLRGRILSRNGSILARNKRQYDLFIIPGYVEDREALFERISDLTGTSVRAMEKRYEEIMDKIDTYAESVETSDFVRRRKERRRRSAMRSPHLLSKYLTFTEAQEIQTERKRYRGTMVKSRPTRAYPYGRTAGALTGYVAKFSRERRIQGRSEYDWMLEKYYEKHLLPHIGSDFFTRLKWRGAFLQGVIGRTGVEKSFDRRLRGQPGVKLIERNLVSGASEVHQDVVPENGEPIRLSVRMNVQKQAMNVIRKIRGAFVMLDVDTGKVRALAARPTYNPNRLISPVSSRAVEEILGSGGPTLFNRAIAGQYPPGSAFKMLVAMAGLETGIITADTTLTCNGVYHYGNLDWKCWIYDHGKRKHGPLTVSQALKRSCNIFFYKLGIKIGGRILRQWTKRFRFGQKTGIELSGETPGSLFESREVVNASIGQGSLTVTPVQLARLTSFVAGGNPYRNPTLLKNPRRSLNPETLDVDPGTLETIRKGMYAVVNEDGGTANREETSVLYNGKLGYRVAGKTSTAQVGGDRKPHAWFVGFAPFEDPEVAFVLIYEHGESGGGGAAPLVGKILKGSNLQFDDDD